MISYEALLAVNVTSLNTNAITLNASIQFNSTIYVNQWTLKGAISIAQVNQIQVVSNPKSLSVNAEGLQNFVNLVLNITVPTFDQAIRNGYPLPQKEYINMTNTTMTVETGYFYILSTPVFEFPTSLSQEYYSES